MAVKEVLTVCLADNVEAVSRVVEAKVGELGPVIPHPASPEDR